MRKIFFLLLTPFLLYACSDKDSEGDQPKITFQIKAVNQIDFGARSSVHSQEPIQSIESVRILACQDDGTGNDFVIKKVFDVTGWTLGTTSLSYVASVPDDLPLGLYHFLVIGRKASDAYNTLSIVEGTSKVSELFAGVNTPDQVDELFIGNADATLTAYGAAIQLQMTRIVAGLLGYFKNVPRTIGADNVASLRLTISDPVIQVSPLGATTFGSSFDILNIDLTGQTVVDGVYSGNSSDNPGVVQLAQSQLAGAYLLPTQADVTMTLGLYNAAGTALKTWNVTSDGNSPFSILQNHFYSFGHKEVKTNTTGVGGTFGNPDVALDLLSDQEIVLTVDPTWTGFPVVEITP